MSKSLIIAEKPSVAADLAKALGKIPKSGDHYENDDYVITSAVGHLVELEMPEDIDKKKYGFWRLETLPIIRRNSGSKPIAIRRAATIRSRSCSRGKTSKRS
jgi:DNA topoisomerase-3